MVATVHMLGLKSSDRLYNALPLYHTAGGLVGTGAALVDGIPSVIRARFSASNYWTDCIKYDCTVIISNKIIHYQSCELFKKSLGKQLNILINKYSRHSHSIPNEG
jgi:acyl-CoA synthetase (AMP-forming)/AMP-acid ligase II